MLRMEDYNKGLIYTDIKDCIDCNKCIHECPILKSNVSVQDKDRRYKVCVDGAECILCGTCLDTCVHDVRHYIDDCDDFLEALRRGEAYSVLVAPAFYLSYPKEARRVLGYLRSLGSIDFYPVSFGADITTWGYLNYISENNTEGNIAQPCPSIVSHIEKHLPELLPKLLPIQSPLMCTAIYLKRYMGIPENLAFLSPCIAKKTEILSKRGQGLIKYNLTFKKLMQHIKVKNIDLSDYPEAEDKISYGMGGVFPKPGGLRENVEYYLGPEAFTVQVDGERRAYEYLRSFAERLRNNIQPLPMLIDVLNCSEGCSRGTGTEQRHKDDDSIAFESLIMRKKKYDHVLLDPKLRFAKLNERFKELNLPDFICDYDKGGRRHTRHISTSEVEDIYWEKLMKFNHEDKRIDCSACGYPSCRQMAEAIAHGINHQGNCVYYMRNSLSQSIQEILSAEIRLRTIIDNMPLVTNVIDENLKIIDCNEEALKLFDMKDKQEYIDRFEELWLPIQPDGASSQKRSRAMYKKTLEEGHTRFDWMYQKLNGELIPCEVTLVRVSRGEEDHIMAFIRDLREQREMMAKLEEALNREQAASSAKSRFLSNMSHEIRTPMNAIMGMTRIAREAANKESKDQYLEKITQASDHLLGLINQILDMSKIEADKLELDYQSFELEKMLNEVSSVLSIDIESKQLKLVSKIAKEVPRYIISDELRLAQVITNLLANAIKFTPKGGTISLGAQLTDSKTLQIDITDTGIGISEEQQSRLFSAFEQAEAGITRKYGGTGLGLVISKRIVEMLGGKIWVESKPKKGSKFAFTIDYKEGKTPPKDREQKTKIKKDAYKGRRLLLAEDIEINREIVIAMLEPTGITIESAEDGIQAVQLFTQSPDQYDLILMDLQMPHLDGLSAAKQIRALGTEKSKQIPIIAMTANVFQEDIEACLAAGMNAHLGKPLDIALVLEQIDQNL